MTTAGRLPLFRTALAFFAVCGIGANLGLITDWVRWVRFGSRAYRDLSLNPTAYGRLIAPETIASLRDPFWLWAANLAAVLAAMVGLFLAVSRFRSAPEAAVRGMDKYRRWKLRTAVATATAAMWAGFANYYLQGAATRHISVGTWDPWVWPLVLFFGALIPYWWIGKALEDRSAAT